MFERLLTLAFAATLLRISIALLVWLSLAHPCTSTQRDNDQTYCYSSFFAVVLVIFLHHFLVKIDFGECIDVLRIFGFEDFMFGENLEKFRIRGCLVTFLANVSIFLFPRCSNKRMFRVFGEWDVRLSELILLFAANVSHASVDI